MAYLDLSVHDFEDIKGKLIALNGRDYELYDVIDEGGEVTVFALLNTKSRQTDLVAKIYHYLPGAPEFEGRAEAQNRIMFALGCGSEEDGKKHIAFEAHYEICGGSISIQKFYGFINTEWTKADLVNRSAEMIRKRRFAEAVALCDEILAAVPFHTAALVNKAAALGQDGQLAEAAVLMFKAVEIEPNLPDLSRALARYLRALGKIDMAAQALQDALARWRYDGWTWRMLVDLAIEYDMTDRIESELQFGLALEPDRLAEVAQKVSESRKRREDYEREFATGLAAQREADWATALAAMTRARNSSKRNDMAVLNQQICRYHLKDRASIADEALPLFSSLGVPLFAAILVSMLSLVELGDYARAKGLALFLAEQIDNPVDLPRLPRFVIEEMAIEEMPVEEIVAAINQIRSAPGTSPAEAQLLERLIAQYDKLAALSAKGGEPGANA